MHRENKESLPDNNRIYVSGRIAEEPGFSHEVYGEGFYNLKIEVARLSNIYDVLPVTVSERLMDLAALSQGTQATIWGQIRSYNSYVQSERKNRLLLSVFVRDLRLQDDGEPGSDADDGRRNPNDVFLNGYICKPPTHRLTPFGREITDLLVAVNRSYNKSDYIPCIAWGRNSRYAGGLGIGNNIKIWGRMQSRGYQKKYDDGSVEDRVAYEVSVSKIETVEGAAELPDRISVDNT
ncbi:MAG: single-stranded DNA-binding protein [Defluviitaleaceae bacterium]|nr:single-stranded DNA-binding protein [Defluviitaleaceae bacterium]